MKIINTKQLKIFSLVFLSSILILGVSASQIPVSAQQFDPEKSGLRDVAQKFENLLNQLGINASELTLKPGENVTVILQKLKSDGKLAEFEQKFTESSKALGIDVDKLKSLVQSRNLTDLKIQDGKMLSERLGNNSKIVADKFSNLLDQLGINASELTLKPGENVTVLLEKFKPDGKLAEFAKKFSESLQKSGIDVDKLKSLKQVENLTQSAKELAELP
ncbi:MAG: hypothetical protein MRJ93_14885 [Nitrososphaeraceae archaeon]|nr:hypothetical protein [Nitrososphaeraceae archaeon]